MLSETKVEPKMKTTVGRLKCPESRWEVVEVEVDAYECPNCGRLVADSQENYSIGVWAGPEPVLVCPECLTIIRGYLHHEDPSGASIIIEVDEKGGYMHVFHKGCSKAQNGLGYMRLRRMCVDPETKQWLRKHGYKGEPGSRVVLVYVCEDCGAQQVVKAGLEDTRIWNTYTERWWKP